jgi:AcrR family transcriptional regulator
VSLDVASARAQSTHGARVGAGRDAGAGPHAGAGRDAGADPDAGAGPDAGVATAGGRRERRKAENRAAILEAARAVFAELGYDAAGVRDIVRRTDLAAGTFYNYFPDKEAVFRAIVDESARELRVRLREVRTRARTLEAFVGDGYRVWFEFLAGDPLMFELMKRNAGPIRVLFGEPILGSGVDELLADLTDGIARGDIPQLDAGYMAGAMAGVALELGVRMAERDPPDVDGAAAFATELFVGGIARLGGPPARP